MMFTGENFNGLVHICLGLYFGLAIFFWLSQKFLFVWLFVIRWVIFVWFIFFVSSKFSLFAFPIASNCFFFLIILWYMLWKIDCLAPGKFRTWNQLICQPRDKVRWKPPAWSMKENLKILSIQMWRFAVPVEVHCLLSPWFRFCNS